MSTEQKNNTKIFIVVIGILLIGIAVAGYFIFSQKSQIDVLQEETNLNKKQLEDEYENLAVQYEGFKLNIKNDSLLQRLTNEQTKVQRLLEELKTVKADNQSEISRLNKELASLRKILKSYIVQIDSLNRANEQLKKEKKEITTKYEQATHTLNQVSQEKENLTEKVTLASKLDASGISIQATNSKGKVQKKIKKVEQLVLNFTITKNITAEPGERTIYVRIMKPDNDVLTKSRTNVFPFENKDINYSMKKIIEYGGEEMPVTMYWIVEEYLMPGEYRVDIFADGNRIGMKSFTMED
ncbi:hypothetical protein [Dysgonomonas sp. Marseille-P4361]|uniref:hypothetical protein n=1 Tax=Dysgonomonas sp. Marseille-P4361 TaxID=2161820 RepID=UPI000D55F925|nr:hypothetical protein [Dysgonomonas sp. Marseille-P4361]